MHQAVISPVEKSSSCLLLTGRLMFIKINTPWPKPKRHDFVDTNTNCIFLKKIILLPIQPSLNFVCDGRATSGKPLAPYANDGPKYWCTYGLRASAISLSNYWEFIGDYTGHFLYGRLLSENVSTIRWWPFVTTGCGTGTSRTDKSLMSMKTHHSYPITFTSKIN